MRHLIQMPADGVEAIVAGHPRIIVERLHELESRGWTMHHRRRNRSAERDHRIVGHPLEQAIQREDLGPVRVLDPRRLVVNRRDRRLQLIRADRPLGQRAGNQRDAVGDRALIPERSILLVEGYQLAVRAGARGAARVREQEERKQAGDFSVVRTQRGESRASTESLPSERSVRCSAVPTLLEYPSLKIQIQDVQDRAQSRSARSFSRGVGMLNGILDVLMLCLARLIRCAIVASGTRNAFAISAVVKPPTARRVSAIADGRVNAGWQHMKRRMSVSSSSTPISASFWMDDGVCGELTFRDDIFAATSRQLAAQMIGHAPDSDLKEPTARIVWNPSHRPLLRRRDQRFLNRVVRVGEGHHTDAQ